jgi:hypothetical protein
MVSSNQLRGLYLEQLKEIIDVINAFSPTPLAVIGLTLVLGIILALKM